MQSAIGNDKRQAAYRKTASRFAPSNSGGTFTFSFGNLNSRMGGGRECYPALPSNVFQAVYSFCEAVRVFYEHLTGLATNLVFQ